MRAYADSKAFNRAVETAREALERYESGGRKAQAAALEMLALGLSQCGELLEAVKATQQQAAILLEEGDKTGRARALRSLCRLCAHHRDFEQGIEAASEAASISAELNQSEQALALQLLADCHRWNDAYTDARQVAAQARQLYRRLGDRNNEVCAVLQACHASALGGDRATALELAGEAQDIAKRAGCKSLQGICWQALASLHWDWGRLADALKMAKKALACARRAGNCKDECRCILLLVIMNLAISQCQDDSGTGSQEEQASRRSSRLQAAEELAEEASRLSDVAGDAECSACSLHAIAMVQIQAQRYDEAFRTAQDAMKKYQEIQDLMGILQMFLGMAKILLQARSFEEAAAAAESALWLAEQAGCKEMEEQARAALEEVEQAAEAESSRGSRPRSRSSSNARVPELPNLPKLELAQACDPQLVRGVIEKFVNVLIGSDDLVEPDRPLMEMGLTSHLAVVLRDQLAKVLPVLTPPLPVTLIYDYPSTAAISQLVVASAGASLRRTRA
ncbi:unnamed protein product [Effrenium voratum]|uniref:Polyketide synthase-like phosphopantetheine-binding domain-containing protein n=1 Tax=Effrenium voratum TaxID=2562239 RepID=A0AA36I2C8_9DINO|nr:unnamed protein product [Effrenium voratum]